MGEFKNSRRYLRSSFELEKCGFSTFKEVFWSSDYRTVSTQTHREKKQMHSPKEDSGKILKRLVETLTGVQKPVYTRNGEYEFWNKRNRQDFSGVFEVSGCCCQDQNLWFLYRFFLHRFKVFIWELGEGNQVCGLIETWLWIWSYKVCTRTV